MKVADKVKAAVEEAHRKGEHPTRVHLTVDDGRKLHFEIVQEGGRIAKKVEKQGLHNAVHKVAGVEVVWRSPEFRVT